MLGYVASKLFVSDKSIRAPLTQPTAGYLISVYICIANYLISQLLPKCDRLNFFAFRSTKVEKSQRIKDFSLNIDGFATMNKVNFFRKLFFKSTSNTN